MKQNFEMCVQADVCVLLVITCKTVINKDTYIPHWGEYFVKGCKRANVTAIVYSLQKSPSIQSINDCVKKHLKCKHGTK